MTGQEQAESMNQSIVHLTEVGSRMEADGTERRLHLGYSAEGFHAGVQTGGAPYEWGKPHPEAGAALNTAWDKGPDKGEQVAELPEHVKAQANVAVAESGSGKLPVQEMGGTPADKLADSYDTKAMEAQREQQRQNALDAKNSEPNNGPDKG